jgi:spermidine/putrescine-binding protein
MESQDYLVLWLINVHASSEEEAAKEAQRFMQDPETLATYFDVVEYHPEMEKYIHDFLDENAVQIDLGEAPEG